MPAARSVDTELVAQVQAVLRTGQPVRLAVLFGSAATGSARPDSDLDIAVLEHGACTDSSSESSLARELTLTTRREVDLVPIEQASTLLKWRIATTGVPLVEARPGEFARFCARAAAEYIDYAPALTYHGEVFRRRLMERGRSQ